MTTTSTSGQTSEEHDGIWNCCKRTESLTQVLIFCTESCRQRLLQLRKRHRIKPQMQIESTYVLGKATASEHRPLASEAAAKALTQLRASLSSASAVEPATTTVSATGSVGCSSRCNGYQNECSCRDVVLEGRRSKILRSTIRIYVLSTPGVRLHRVPPSVRPFHMLFAPWLRPLRMRFTGGLFARGPLHLAKSG